uniref:C2 domain-containing protein n=1 Tax=Octactis speculum TaxID=3111310 RepID=A0A7S2M9Y3_9STRA|mmetsp:Transcript_58401/g.79623  ORF Transcript_58401/g.79623 Transcript_58401/m.79623 type:complete len:528 (+) Transcript_58401:2-1585(+)
MGLIDHPPKRSVVRIYIVSAKNLQPVGGGLSDPYIRIRLGKTYINDVQTVQKQTLDPGFYKFYELDAAIPGSVSLKIELRDWQYFPLHEHELIGETTIDLEDRWFQQKWQSCANGLERDEVTGEKYDIPIEMRSLYLPGNPVSQGQLEMWVEILPADKARNIPISEMSGPVKKKFEIRIICWKAEGIPKSAGEDFYCRFTVPNQKPKSTDTHWKCKARTPSWNYRIKFQVELPLKNPLEGSLSIQLWDKDILTADEIIGEMNLDIYPWLLMAYHRDGEVAPFKEINIAEEKMKNAEEAENDEAGESGLGDTMGLGLGFNFFGEDEHVTKKKKVLGQDQYQMVPFEVVDGDPSIFNANTDSNAEAQEEDKQAEDAEEEPGTSSDEEDDESEVDDGEAARDFINTLKGMAGLGEIAEDARWLNMMHHNHKKKKLVNKGKVAVTVTIVPETDAVERPVGNGRDEPNNNPMLPPPVGRLSLSFNPLAVLKELISPAVVFYIICCICCVLCLMAMAYLGTYYMTIYTLINSL